MRTPTQRASVKPRPVHTTAVAYGWDDAGNRTSAGSATFAYDERNRLTSGPDGTQSWSPRGTLDTVAGPSGTTAYTFDALGRLTGYDGTVAYAYDGFDRIAQRGTAAFAYAGTEIDPVADGTSLYSRSPGGDLLALAGADGTNDHIVGRNRHGDLTHLFDADGDLDTTRTYDPFGASLATTGAATDVGFQGDWTDPASGKVWMGARWYDGGDAAFASRDTVSGGLDNPVGLNRYTYSFGDPLGYFDPDGHWPSKLAGLRGAMASAWSRDGTRTAVPADRRVGGDGTPVPPNWDKMSRANRNAWTKKHCDACRGPKVSIMGEVTAGLKTGGKSFSNFSAGLVDGGTDLATFGKLKTNIGPLYTDDIHAAASYGFGRSTAGVMNAAAAVYAAPQLARSALAGVRTLRSAGSLGEAVAVTRQAVGARVDRAAAAIKGAAQGIRNAPSSLMARVRPSELGELRWGGAAPQGARGSTVGELRASGQADAHHIIQDAAVRDVPGYKTNAAPGIRLDGPSTTPGSPHYNATQVQRTAGVGGTYGAERQAGCMALAAAGCSPAEITDAISRADDYFMGELGLTLDSPLRIPGNRRIP